VRSMVSSAEPAGRSHPDQGSSPREQEAEAVGAIVGSPESEQYTAGGMQVSAAVHQL